MNCDYCGETASFRCRCKNVNLCSMHFGGHLLVKGHHDFTRLAVILNEFDETLLHEELIARIAVLKLMKKKLLLTTEKLISKIKENYFSALQNLKNKEKSYKKMLQTKTFQESEMDEVKLILKTKIKSADLLSKNLMIEIKNFFETRIITEADQMKARKFIQKKFLSSHMGGIRTLVCSKDLKNIIFGSEDCTVRIWDQDKNVEKVCFLEHLDIVQCLNVSSDEKFLLSGGYDNRIIMYCLKSYKIKKRFLGASGVVLSVCFSMDNTKVLASTRCNDIIIITIETETIRRIETSETVFVFKLLSIKDILLAKEENLELYDLSAHNIMLRKKLHKKTIMSIAITNNQKFIITGSQDASVKVSYKNKLSLFCKHEFHSGPVLSVALTTDENAIISAAQDEKIIHYSIREQVVLKIFWVHHDLIYAVASVDDYIISGSRDSRIGITRISSGETEKFLGLKPYSVNFETVKGNTVLFGSLCDVVIYDMTQPEKEIELKGHNDLVYMALMDSKNEKVISCSRGSERNLLIWDLLKRELKAELKGHNCSVFTISLSIDDNNILSGDYSGLAIFWSLCDYSLKFKLQGHSNKILTSCICKGSKRGITASEDGLMCIWSLCDGLIQSKIEGHFAAVTKILVTPDDEYLISCNRMEKIKIWQLSKNNQEIFLGKPEDSILLLEKYELLPEVFHYLRDL